MEEEGSEPSKLEARGMRAGIIVAFRERDRYRDTDATGVPLVMHIKPARNDAMGIK